jgi:hypothetical protein
MSLIRRTASVRPRFAALVLFCASLGVTGCTAAMKDYSPSNIWHNMQPHRLQRLNQGQGMSTDAYFSVSDPIPELESNTDKSTDDAPAQRDVSFIKR